MKSKKVGAILSIVLFSLSVSACSSNMEQQRMAESATESESITEEQTEEETEKETETEKQTESEKETQEETETTKESEDNNKDESTTETKSNESKDNKVPETSKTSTPKEDSKPVETTAPKEEHKHNFTSTDSPSSCTVAGIRTYTCTTCGYSYTENLGYGAHDFSIPVYQTVHHEAVYETVKRELPNQKIIICSCGAEFTTNEGYDNHVISQIGENPFTACGSSYIIEDRPGGVTYDYVEISPAYDSEEIVYYKCSICGQTQ